MSKFFSISVSQMNKWNQSCLFPSELSLAKVPRGRWHVTPDCSTPPLLSVERENRNTQISPGRLLPIAKYTPVSEFQVLSASETCVGAGNPKQASQHSASCLTLYDSSPKKLSSLLLNTSEGSGFFPPLNLLIIYFFKSSL